jgi:hypothetical protein
MSDGMNTKVHPGRCIDFIEEEAKTTNKTPKRLPDTNATPHGLTTQPTPINGRTHLVPSLAKNGEEAIHRASRQRHNQIWELHETESNSEKAQANALPAHKRLRVSE